MIRPVLFNELAELEIEAAYNGYEDRQQGLGERFLECTREATLVARTSPEAYRPIEGDFAAEVRASRSTGVESARLMIGTLRVDLRYKTVSPKPGRKRGKHLFLGAVQASDLLGLPKRSETCRNASSSGVEHAQWTSLPWRRSTCGPRAKSRTCCSL